MRQLVQSGVHRFGQNRIAYRSGHELPQVLGSINVDRLKLSLFCFELPIMASASLHQRNISRSSRPRSSTRGPLDSPDDPLSGSPTLGSPDPIAHTLAHSDHVAGSSFFELDQFAPDDLPETLGKDVSFLLRHDIYHPLSQNDIPSPLRSEFMILNPGEPLSSSLSLLERSLSEGHFLIAAHLASSILTSSLISQTDMKLVFSLFFTRLACLELSGNTALAAQESKALEDLNSMFYYIDSSLDKSDHDTSNDKIHSRPLRHIVPWPLRVLAVRLQSIGFGDSRRSIGGLYELGMEARREVLRKDINQHERRVWRERLGDLGIRSANALVEMGDLDAARRSLEMLHVADEQKGTLSFRKALLFLRMGAVDEAQRVLDTLEESDEAALLRPLLSMSEGRYEDAATEWRVLHEDSRRADTALTGQNMAVCLLYCGKLDEARQLLEAQIQANNSFGSLLFNLSTLYELSSDGAVGMKRQLAATIAKQSISRKSNLDRPNADFKL
ncbi:hypothetical protein POX_b03191 [Penicillium oxalicum]|uniref:hypothetical protein n=1 Tax=Penicillium oxalicum TaxID=69781 RepID=UPI0020B84B0A|nr:hypothetical protein POX_b03191 [Penicillium oxalicum]KAI2793142.1 hypothetical protein POX_b03191 [Penicillium oxalicum]